jgi:hypothetical protein
LKSDDVSKHAPNKTDKLFVGLLVWLLLPPCAAAETQEYDVNAVLRFNLVCAHCHEGECSGRLSFSGGPDAAYDHIRRFVGDVGPKMALQLYAILEYMKQNCAFPPLPPASSPFLDEAILDAYRDAGSGNYFVPLGPVDTGNYAVSVELAQSLPVRLEIITRDFEPLVDECLQAGKVSKPIDVEEPTTLFLRIRALDGLLLRSVRLKRQPRPR